LLQFGVIIGPKGHNRKIRYHKVNYHRQAQDGQIPNSKVEFWQGKHILSYTKKDSPLGNQQDHEKERYYPKETDHV
jgi:hypothetical protein